MEISRRRVSFRNVPPPANTPTHQYANTKHHIVEGAKGGTRRPTDGDLHKEETCSSRLERAVALQRQPRAFRSSLRYIKFACNTLLLYLYCTQHSCNTLALVYPYCTYQVQYSGTSLYSTYKLLPPIPSISKVWIIPNISKVWLILLVRGPLGTVDVGVNRTVGASVRQD